MARAEEEEQLEASAPQSLDQLVWGQPIAQGCNAVVYSARLAEGNPLLFSLKTFFISCWGQCGMRPLTLLMHYHYSMASTVGTFPAQTVSTVSCDGMSGQQLSTIVQCTGSFKLAKSSKCANVASDEAARWRGRLLNQSIWRDAFGAIVNDQL